MPSNWFSSRTNAGQIQGGLTSVAASSFISDLRFSYSYLNNILDPVTAKECQGQQCVGVSGPDILVFDAASFRMGHHVTVPKTMHTRTSQIVGNVTWQRGAHRVRFGGEWEHLNLNSIHSFYDPPQVVLWGPTDLQRSAAYQSLYDALPLTLRDPEAGPPTLSDILRLPLRSFMIGIGNPMQPGPYHHDDVSHPDLVRFYVEDGFTVRPSLTLVFGLAVLADKHLQQGPGTSQISLATCRKRPPSAASRHDEPGAETRSGMEPSQQSLHSSSSGGGTLSR